MCTGNFKGTHRYVALIAIIFVLAISSRSALADDPCQEPTKQVVALIGALNKAVYAYPNPGRFAVKRLSPEGEAGKFQVSYLIDNRPVFARSLEQLATISEHFGASASPPALELYYAFGAGGGVSCTYQITRTPQTFIARIRGNGEKRFGPLPK